RLVDECVYEHGIAGPFRADALEGDVALEPRHATGARQQEIGRLPPREPPDDLVLPQRHGCGFHHHGNSVPCRGAHVKLESSASPPRARPGTIALHGGSSPDPAVPSAADPAGARAYR